ncbi:MAG TPA: triose-phosphate isomerase [Acidimicrobiales bacterium]|nr:triose-phosphate isomerase [Acidimicrobiales bacterium]
MTSRRPLVLGNWKLNCDHVQAVHLVTELALRLRGADVGGVDVGVAPPFTDLRSVSSVLEAEQVDVALVAQHASEHDEGAFTGEVAVSMLHRLGVTYVLAGHSERRRYFHMDDETVARTAAAVRRGGCVPVVCVGETADEREEGRTEEVLERQLRAALGGLDDVDAERLVVAYEPVWAIGTGQSATPEDAEAAASFLRGVAKGPLGDGADRLRVLYGGSVDGDNAGDLVAPDDVDGLLVGGASLSAQAFTAVVTGVADCYRSRARSPRR